MEIGVLGAVTVDGVAIPAGKQLTLLAALACHANRPVSGEVLARAAWPSAAPSPGTFRWHLHRLRATVGDRLVRGGDGHMLIVADDELDAVRFTRLIQRAALEPAERALPLLDQALALWRGEAYSGLHDLEDIRVEAAALHEARLAAIEARAKALMLLGRHAECASDMATAVAEQPLRESFIELWLRALAADGRPAEALRAYGRIRAQLVEELGVEPSGPLRRLHEELLRHDPAPRLLPPDVYAFTGRMKELAVLDQLLHGPPNVAVISGVGGVGKSGLALHWAHQSSDHFPDGQLYADLGRHTVAEVLTRFLAVLGVILIPEDHTERVALYRQMLAERRMLILLDNASGSVEVEPLLPGASGCVTMVTGRSRFEKLVADRGALLIQLEVLPPAEAALLIGRIARIDPGHAATLVELCARLPLALRVAGARLVTRPGWSPEILAARLTEERRLDELRAGELDVRACLEAGYQDLPDVERTLFVCLGLIPAPTFTAWMAAALLNVPVSTGGDLLERLAERQLLQPQGLDVAGQERYRFHDLIRLLARERAGSGPEQDSVRDRFLSCLLALAKDACERAYAGGFRLMDSGAPQWRPRGQVLPDEPMTWMAAERETLITGIHHAAERGYAAMCWDLALAGVRLFEIHGQFVDWEQTARRALQVCRDQDDMRGVGAMLASLSGVEAFQRRHETSLALAKEALPLLGESSIKALTLGNLSAAERALGDEKSALAHITQAVSLAAELGDTLSEAILLARLAFLNGGDPRPMLDKALKLAAGNTRVSLLISLSDLHASVRAGRHAYAETLSLRAIEDARRSGDRVAERDALSLRADSLIALRRPAEAAVCLRRAHELAVIQNVPLEAQRISAILKSLSLLAAEG
ncbi:BTAD domain-containing putative transcriptional regulator [Nonomuraea sp. NPDC049637]|uniref:AfsR/SARP family transcriptional regulator n=1 Tax=Nonomuraea sp. NPDC049637 TaxID=3154356 RepID=UPI003430B875